MLSVPDMLPSRSGRLVLLRPREEDDAAIAALNSHPETIRYLPWCTVLTVEEARELRIARDADPTRFFFNVHLSQDGLAPVNSDPTNTLVCVVGIVYIDYRHNCCEIAVTTSPHHYRAGFATEALYTLLTCVFEELKFHRAGFVTKADNARMCDWLDMVGATVEGMKREGWIDGKGGYADAVMYGILEQEWVETVKPKLEARINRAK
ncbi:Ribosomal-protein-alanine acetyltransferase [Mycena sanguinolenta]|uniref:Ribosomal-protein-alanine acetyltransferase n=1 Tax=Mycena sanguinolenta TaxID=230812 RepID=A0A8H6XZS1_9AGAR|nr:Ribosomal-protein-alanine acetyltransferase [Mycena sanguinolenta]